MITEADMTTSAIVAQEGLIAIRSHQSRVRWLTGKSTACGEDSEGNQIYVPCSEARVGRVQTLPVAHSAAAPAQPPDFSGASAGKNRPIAHIESVQTSRCAIEMSKQAIRKLESLLGM